MSRTTYRVTDAAAKRIATALVEYVPFPHYDVVIEEMKKEEISSPEMRYNSLVVTFINLGYDKLADAIQTAAVHEAERSRRAFKELRAALRTVQYYVEEESP